MALVNVSSNDNKELEYSNLEAHVTLCAHRHKSLESKINELQEQSKTYKIFFIRFCVALAVSGISSAAGILYHVSGKM